MSTNKGVTTQGGAGGNTLIMYDEEMSSSYWAKNKKFSVDLRESAFATDRQLEDQRFLRDNNRNKWNNVLMKCDKTKSEKLGKLKKNNPAAIKAKVLNKIVREASGAHNYALVPPIAKKKKARKHGEDPGSPIDPDKNPYVDVYRKESNSKPVIMTFGHRPRSASRVFHPGTMKIHLKSGEIVPSGPSGKSGFGLSVVQLSQVLQAPKIRRPGEEFLDDEEDSLAMAKSSTAESMMTEGVPMPQLSPGDFKLPDSDSTTVRTQSGGMANKPSKLDSLDWGNMSQTSSKISMRRKKKAKLKKLSTMYDHKTEWNESFHHIKRNPNEKFLLRASGLNEVKEMSLAERLQRFNRNASTIEASSGMCVEKRLLDLELQKPQPLRPRKNAGESLSDPRTDAVVRELEKQYSEQLEAKDMKERELRYRDALRTVPDINYYPESVHASLVTGEVDFHGITEAQLSARSQTSDLTFSVAGAAIEHMNEEESEVESVLSSSKAGKGVGVGGKYTSSFASSSSLLSGKVLEISSGPYSKLKEKKKKEYRSPKKVSSPESRLNDYDFKFLDEALLHKPPPESGVVETATRDMETEIADLMTKVDVEEREMERGDREQDVQS